MLLDGFSLLGHVKNFAASSWNLGVKVGGGALSVAGLPFGKALDIQEWASGARIDVDSPFADMVGSSLQPTINNGQAWLENEIGIGGTIILGATAEFALDVAAVVPALSSARGLSPIFNRAVQSPIYLDLNGSMFSLTGTPPFGVRSLLKPAVVPLEVGTYGSLALRSVGDGLSPDHVPSLAAIKEHLEQKLGVRLTEQQVDALRRSTNTIAIDTDVHMAASRTYGGRNTAAQIAIDAADLGAAAVRDLQALRPSLVSRGYGERQIQEAFDAIHAANRAKGYY